MRPIGSMLTAAIIEGLGFQGLPLSCKSVLRCRALHMCDNYYLIIIVKIVTNILLLLIMIIIKIL